MRTLRVGSCVLVCVSLQFFAGCKKQPQAAGKDLSTGQSSAASGGTGSTSVFAWNLRTLTEAYDKSGKRSSKWDESAKRALTEFARSRSHLVETNEPFSVIIATNCDAAVEAGCDDPLIAYLHARFVLAEQKTSHHDLAQAYVQAFEGLEKASYPNIRKFYASLRVAQQLKASTGSDTNAEPEIFEFRNSAVEYLLSALHEDNQIPASEADEACHDILATLQINRGQYRRCYERLEPVLFSKWPQESFIWLLKGEGNTEMAWRARGSGYANTVTEQGWKGFEQHLKIADEALNKAWELNPKDTRIAVEMMRVELGQGQGRKRMELWFDRAMEVDTNCYEAASAKLYYLEPKWFGSVQDMRMFGRECVASKKWGGKVPLILVDAHRSIHRQYNTEGANYWLEPGVWEDLQAAFERFFELNPDSVNWRHSYAWYAYHCQQWAALKKQRSLLGTTNYNYFGGKLAFEKMAQAATEHAK